MQLVIHRIEGTRPGPHLLITGGVHGDEFEPMAAVRRLIREVRPEDLSGKLTLIPVVNEPAFRLGRRTADDGLDLARTCPGKPDGSITERIAFALTEQIGGADLYIDLHTGGTRLRVQPLVGYVLHPTPAVLNAQRRMARAFRLPIIWGTDPTLPGRSLSVARDAGVPAIYTEYQGGADLDPQGIDAYVAGCLNVMAEFGLLDRPTMPALPDVLVVEDDRPGSGHMQINHPSPSEGFFQPSVRLGDRVQADDVIGTVTDVLGHDVATIRAQYAGIILVLHIFARIDRGVSVAVVLAT